MAVELKIKIIIIKLNNINIPKRIGIAYFLVKYYRL